MFDRHALLRIRRRDWQHLIGELGRRGQGGREAGAFLLGERAGDGRTVTGIVYFDDLDPHCLTGGIAMNGLAFSRLWDLCDQQNRRVLGDVHTHPGFGVRQSGTDAANPMVARAGHVALIVPHLAQRPIQSRRVGVHRYDGRRFDTWTDAAARRRLRLTSWWWR